MEVLIMSGGSFNYLCYKDVEELLRNSYSETLERMIDELSEMGFTFASEKSKFFETKLKDLSIFLSDIEKYYRKDVYPKWNEVIAHLPSVRDNFVIKDYGDYIHDYSEITTNLTDLKEEFDKRNFTNESQLVDDLLGKLQQGYELSKQLESYRGQFEQLWRSVEWYVSCDSSLSDVEKEAIKFEINYQEIK